MSATAEIVLSRGRYAVKVTAADGLYTDWPIMYDDGLVAYDKPERVPQYIRPVVVELLKQAKARNADLLLIKDLALALKDHHDGTDTLRPFAATFDRDEHLLNQASINVFLGV